MKSMGDIPSRTCHIDRESSWRIAVDGELLDICEPESRSVSGEMIEALPLHSDGAVWRAGYRLRGVCAGECSMTGLLDPESLVLTESADPDSSPYARGVDFDADEKWGVVWRSPDGRIPEKGTVFAHYRHGLLRIDSVVRDDKGRMSVRKGDGAVRLPEAPLIADDEELVANIWLAGIPSMLTEDDVFPVLETAFPEPKRPEGETPAERFSPRSLDALRSGRPIRILAWGDSVTDGGYLADPDRDRWSAQMSVRLLERFPHADIELRNLGWGGRSMRHFLDAPKGDEHNYEEQVLGWKPDLVISEFVNDASPLADPGKMEELYGRVLKDFRGVGAEWIILTPHYVRPDWMNLTSLRRIDDDPRPYVSNVRAFCDRHDVALADASLRWGRLWRRGIPYTAFLDNGINHPDRRGLELFADAVMSIFL